MKISGVYFDLFNHCGMRWKAESFGTNTIKYPTNKSKHFTGRITEKRKGENPSIGKRTEIKVMTLTVGYCVVEVVGGDGSGWGVKQVEGKRG